MLFPLDDPKHIPVATIDGTAPEFQSMARGEIDISQSSRRPARAPSPCGCFTT